MTRRQILQSAFALAAPSASAQTIRYREYSHCLPNYLASLAADAYTHRNRRIEQLTTPAAIHDYQAWARRTFLQLAGPMPERTPLNPRTVGAFERTAYRVERLVYESLPGLYVTANLYIPKSGAKPFPGVLFQMGHSANGKGYAPYQRCCQGLAQLGYLVLAFDPMGQGERVNYPRQGSWLTRLLSSDDEHTYPGRQMLLVGETCTAAQLWDAMRSLDVLASHPLVDARRIASTGQSGGATLTMLLAAADDRLAAAAVCSGNTENFATRPFFSPGSTDDAEQDLVGSAPLGFDRWDLLWPLAPKPLLVATSGHDFFGTYSGSYEASGREEFGKLLRAYGDLGAPGNLKSFVTPLPHGLTLSLRIATYDWFERHLKSNPRGIQEEPPTGPEKDEVLWCGPTGNVVRDFTSKTPFLILRDRARGIATPAKVPDLRVLLGMSPPTQLPQLTIVGMTSYANCDIQAIEVNSAPEVWVPAWFFLPKSPWSQILVILEPNGRGGQWREDDLYPQLAAAGIAVGAADVRGIGDLQPAFSSGGSVSYAREHENEENYAWASLILGHSLLGQRTADIVALTQALSRAHSGKTIVVAARDKMTLPALCAGVLEPKISKLYLARHLVSWRALVESESYAYPLANFVPDVLKQTDLPQLASAMAPRQVIVSGAVDASGRLVSGDQPAWNFESLSRLAV
jgi:dienelactone hydrolase